MPCGFFPLCHDVVISPVKPASSLKIAAGSYLSSCVVAVICVVIRSCLITSLYIWILKDQLAFATLVNRKLKLNPFLIERAGSRQRSRDLCGAGQCAAPFHCSGLNGHVCSWRTAGVSDIFHGLGAFILQGSYALHLLIIFYFFFLIAPASPLGALIAQSCLHAVTWGTCYTASWCLLRERNISTGQSGRRRGCAGDQGAASLRGHRGQRGVPACTGARLCCTSELFGPRKKRQGEFQLQSLYHRLYALSCHLMLALSFCEAKNN